MGRAIKPMKIRRQTHGGQCEVLSASGFWTKWSLLSPASKEMAVARLKAIGQYGWLISTKPGEFDLSDDLLDDDAEYVQNDSDDQDEYDAEQSDSDASSDSETSSDSDAQSDSSDASAPPTIEDIIRQIAGGMDQEVAVKVLEAVSHVMDDKLAAYAPASSSSADYTPITVKVQIETPTVKLEKDGIFHNQFKNLVTLVSSGQHVYLPGPPGTGKSHAAEQVASVLGWRFASISLGPTTPESRLWGGMDAHGKFFEPPFVTLARHAAENPDSGSVFCLDELDNGHAGVIATLNSAMANGWFTAPNGDVITVGRNFVLVGAANTFGTGPTAEFAGRNKLDPATLDRFAYLPWDTDLGVEKALVHQYLDDASAKAWLDAWRTCRKNVKDAGLKVFCTMRGCVNGAKLVAGGMDPQLALDVVLLNKLPDDQRRKVAP